MDTAEGVTNLRQRMAWEQDRGSPQPDDRAADPTWRFEPESVSR